LLLKTGHTLIATVMRRLLIRNGVNRGSQPAISQSVTRGEAIANKNGFELMD